MTRWPRAMVAGLCALLASACLTDRRSVETDRDEPKADAGTIDPLGPNAGCYVCHVTFVEEQLAGVHQQADIGCVACHGPSLPHANDENVGATKPDVVITGDAINPFCRTCHPKHDVAPEKVVARWLERRPTRAASHPTTGSASAETSPVALGDVTCTVCHGRHKIAADQTMRLSR